ncbi:uncharacterized protein LOC128260112 isoform X1 [Drosophila gunungcola]|uniref:uncharacterized protein LOC128260112 isoform X1 n=1 Tax=Drosophila gunungcola TaxID=103775 RepID=UPI0022E3CCA5|nr:uncharacterized protein LOC128260112 isoform X1 [Drosophila gunungcola]XP_052848809.1 uncharacterized protein LOC128260112 isoform X1 [Drosophila gunungcola]XP_052848810.1 uncharacterized protein LOC128260112 isoform X1 [Drosophila gunungcola]XP_052848811.1 uncharacterized protein LOC128260112 isoform X1 [Drosophila gunungcola]XP_052848812.1 uncharacterized protein LOC128260112 isoform X1 [Drosophila gunungcola]XP_052848813.1 uncharacterized protein LOC128260112 isoform X1 [Drosophila gunun
MGCVFEAAKEQPHKPRRKQLRRNQCRGRAAAVAGTRGKDAARANEKPAEDIKIKDNYQQNHKTQTPTETETQTQTHTQTEAQAQSEAETEAATGPEHLKATAQVLLTIRQARQEKSQPGSQVAGAHKDDGEDALATQRSIVDTTARIGIDIAAARRQPVAERDEDDQCRQHHVHVRRRRRHVARSQSPAATAGISALSLHFHALAALAKTLQWQDESAPQDRQPLAYRQWQGHAYADRAEGPLPIVANVGATAAATSAAAFQYLGQHYKHYSQSISFYAASSVILMLCYLTTASTAAATQSETGVLDKHPIHGIDWSKFDESSSDKEILDLLLEKKRYDKRLLPPVNDEDFCCGLQSPDMATNQNARRPHNRGTLTVNVNVLLLSLASPDESSLKYEVEFLLNQQWNDPRLQYGNKSHYDFLNALHHHDSIWTPDTYFIMHGDFKDPIIPMHFALRIYRNGTITYAMRRHLILSCQGSLHIFPFDDPKCSFSMESISYEEAQIKYVWKNDEDTLRKSPSLTTLNAYLIKNQTTACDQNSWRGNYSCLQVELTFTRDRAYYFTTVFIPGIILVTSSFITFWLEWNAVPARVMIGVTTMLNFFTTSNGFRSTLPVVSNLTAMNVWDGVCMCFIYASLLEFVCVNYVGRKRPLHNVVYRPGENPVTQRLPAVLSRIGVILASPLASAAATPAMSMMGGATPMSSGTPAASSSVATPGTPRTTDPEEFFGGGMRWQEAHGGIIGAAVHNLRARSIKRKAARSPSTSVSPNPSGLPPPTEHIYEEPGGATSGASNTKVKFKDELKEEAKEEVKAEAKAESLALRRSVATSTPALVVRIEAETDLVAEPAKDMEMTERQLPLPLKPPRRKASRSNSPASVYGECSATDAFANAEATGEKRRDAGAPNEIVACTTCGGSNSPCTHSANNGCATETCFVQVRKKEPPHPIRVAKTIDVIARITFPTAYAIFLIFFFVHYKGFS